MYFIVHCIDNPNSSRAALHAEHRAYLESQPLKIYTAGPLMDDSGEKMIGSMLILECNSRAEIDAFITEEPFNKGGVFASVNIHRWDKRH